MVRFDLFGRGPHKVLGLHGWFGDETSFKSLECSLDPDLFQCAWLAHRGYGKSLQVEGKYTIEEMAEDAIDVAGELGWSAFSVIGHSMGGKAAQLVAATRSQSVRKLVAVTPVSVASVQFDQATRGIFEEATGSVANRIAIIDLSTGHRLSRVWISNLASTSMRRSVPEAFSSYFRSWADDDYSARVAGCAAETLVLVGEHDLSITIEVAKTSFEGRFSKAKICALSQSGHYPMDEVPLALGAEILEFLSSGSEHESRAIQTGDRTDG
jgi:pimeloyl-ACP methyl ester carboxylesterase